MSRLDKIPAALLTVMDNVGHYAPFSLAVPYAVWAEDSTADECAGDRNELRVDCGTIDLYTKTESDPLCSGIEQALENAEICWYKNSIQYEDETGLIHHEWAFEVGD